MLLNTYQTNLILIIEKYVDNGYILSFSFAVDARSDYIGFIHGCLEFIHGSRLYFKEYVDLQDSSVKLSYSFHYQCPDNRLIFRYDNARHKPDLEYSDHKHTDNTIMPANIPALEDVILEIINQHLIDNKN
ncbi:MAG: toxin-antitoxin system TumE family protein [Synechocystis sp.]